MRREIREIRDALEAFEAAVEAGEMIGFQDGGAPDDGATPLTRVGQEMHLSVSMVRFDHRIF
jgi:hypothetical protein